MATIKPICVNLLCSICQDAFLKYYDILSQTWLWVIGDQSSPITMYRVDCQHSSVECQRQVLSLQGQRRAANDRGHKGETSGDESVLEMQGLYLLFSTIYVGYVGLGQH